MADAQIKTVADFFKTGDKTRDALSQFSAEWKELDETGKQQLRAGIGEGTLSY